MQVIEASPAPARDRQNGHVECGVLLGTRGMRRADGTWRSWRAPAEPGFLVPRRGGRLICGMRGGLYDFDSVTGAFTLLVPIEHDKPRHRINDGFVDNAGRLWFGTLHEDCKIEGGALYGWQKDRPVVCHDAGYVVTNGPAVSPDGSALYHTDSGARTVYVFEVSASATLSRKRPFIHFPEEGVYPDGMAVDSAGHLWIALFNGWRVEQYSAQGNKLDEIRFRVPTSRSLRLAATSCALSMSQQLGPA